MIMKKWMAMLLGIGLLWMCNCALADADQFCDAMPQGVRELAQWDNIAGDFCDCILFPDLPAGTYCMVLSPGWMNGYALQDGVWKREIQVSPMQPTIGLQPHFRRHVRGAAPGIQGTCGLLYPDDMGFDIIKGYPTGYNPMVAMIQVHWMDDGFRLIGWQASSAGQFALWEDGVWTYYDSGTGERLGSARIDRLMEYGLLVDFDDLPHTLDEARRMEAITRATVETLFPGWTLLSYWEINMGSGANVGYYHIADGVLTIRRVELSSNTGGIIRQTESMPVPLSKTLLKRLETEDVDTLLNSGGFDNTFLTADAFDQTAIPVPDTVLQNDLQSHGLLLLTEDAQGVRRLRWVERDGDGYTMRSTRPLPDDARLDLFHTGDGGISLEWGRYCGECSFSRTADGNWTLGWVTKQGVADSMYGTLYCGVQRYLMTNTPASVLVGSHPWSDLFAIDFSQLPVSNGEAAAALNRDGWAVVNNPDLADRLPLRAGPNRAYESLGEFYNRTPVQVLAQQGNWSRVRIGLDGRLEGWMRSEYLAFGGAMDTVDSAYLNQILRKDYRYQMLFASPAMRETTGVAVEYDTWIVGVVANDLYILLDSCGNTGYLPQSWFWPGNS